MVLLIFNSIITFLAMVFYRLNTNTIINLSLIVSIERVNGNNFTLFLPGRSYLNLTLSEIQNIIAVIGTPVNF